MTAQVMKILNGLELSLTRISGTPRWNHGDPTIHPRAKRGSINHTNRFHLIRTWRLHAEGKGFNRGPARILQRKDTENAARESNNRSKVGDSDDGEIPDVVQRRIISRILLYVGVPLATGLLLLKVFGAAKEQNWWDVPYWLPILTTFITFGASTLGISYGALSTSWDANREGSFLGIEEAEKNWVEMWREEDDD